MRKFIISVLVALVASFIVAIIGVYCLMSVFTHNRVLWDTAIFNGSLFWNFTVLLTVILAACLIFLLAKYKFFTSSKLIRKNDRTTSNLFDNQDFMKTEDLYQNFGNYDFTELHKTEGVTGYVLNSQVVKDKLRLSLIPNQHAMLIGTPGSGKSLYEIGLTIQANAVSKEKPSMIINDLAGELYEQHSAQLIKQGYQIAVINLRDPHKTITRYNPCSYIWDLYHAYLADPTRLDLLDRVAVNINEIARCICPDTTGQDKNWAIGARGILIGCLWAMLEDSAIPEFRFSKDMYTITQVSNIVNRQKEQLLDFLFMRNIDSKVYDYAGTIKDNSSEKTVDSYISHLIPSLSLFLETGIQYLTAATDIDLNTITQQPTAIFVIVPSEFASRYIIGTMIYTQIYTHLAYEASQNPSCRLNRTIYYLLDEFGNMPKIEDFKIWIATCRKMRIFFFIVLQSTKQLDDVYGDKAAVSIRDCCQCQMYLGANDDSTIEYFQKKFGTYTALQRNQNLDTQNLSITEFKGSTSLAKKDLVTKSELQILPAGTMYSHIIRHKPLKSSLVIIYDNRLKNIITIGKQKEPELHYAYENKIYDIAERTTVFTGAPPAPKPTPSGAADINVTINSNTEGEGEPDFSLAQPKKNNSVDATLDFLKR